LNIQVHAPERMDRFSIPPKDSRHGLCGNK
jgi:hypothetical protein